MIILTTSYQQLAQKYLGNSYGDLYVRIYAKYSEQDIENNKTKVQYQARAYFSGNWIRDNQGNGNVSGTSATTTTGACTYPQKGETIIATTEAWVTHESDGKKEISASAYLNFPNWGWSATASGTADLPTIPKAATVTAAQNFNDEENPTITYSNPAGTAVTTLQACIASSDGNTIYVAYRDISKTGTSYTFNLTDAERNVLRNASVNANSININFYIKTIIGNNTYIRGLKKTLSIINANPVITASAKDTGTTSITLTGDSNKMIKGYNGISATMSANGLKGAYITSYKITNGNIVVNGSTAYFGYTSNNSFVFTATDSRGNTATKTITLEMINYIPLTCNMDIASPSADGKLKFTISGNYFNSSFGAVNNNLQVDYIYKEYGGSYGNWVRVTPTIKNNTYSAEVEIAGLDYKKTYIIKSWAGDTYYFKGINDGVYTNEQSVKVSPVFDWGENDISFNVPVSCLMLQSPNKTTYLISVNDSGLISATKIN